MTYTPTTDEVRAVYWKFEFNRDHYREQHGGAEPLSNAEYMAEFDRWLAKVKSDVWVEAIHHVENALGPVMRIAAMQDNPYSDEAS